MCERKISLTKCVGGRKGINSLAERVKVLCIQYFLPLLLTAKSLVYKARGVWKWSHKTFLGNSSARRAKRQDESAERIKIQYSQDFTAN